MPRFGGPQPLTKKVPCPGAAVLCHGFECAHSYTAHSPSPLHSRSVTRPVTANPLPSVPSPASLSLIPAPSASKECQERFPHTVVMDATPGSTQGMGGDPQPEGLVSLTGFLWRGFVWQTAAVQNLKVFLKGNKGLEDRMKTSTIQRVWVFQGWCSPFPTPGGWSCVLHAQTPRGAGGTGWDPLARQSCALAAWLHCSALGCWEHHLTLSHPWERLGRFFWGWFLLHGCVTHGARTWCCQSSAFQQLRSSAPPAPFQGLLQ